MKNLGLVQLMELKRQKEQTLWTLGFRLAPRELFDTIVEIDMETLVPGFEDLLDFVKLQEYIRD